LLLQGSAVAVISRKTTGEIGNGRWPSGKSAAEPRRDEALVFEQADRRERVRGAERRFVLDERLGDRRLADSSNLLCSNFSILCSNQTHLDCSLIRTVRPGNFSGCQYPGENLHGLNLSGDCLAGTNFAGANLSNSDLSCTNLEGANLAGANLNGAILENADLSGALLGGANLNNANLIKAILFGATLAGTNLHGANLTGANLTRAILTGANLHGANLTNVIWDDTTCPDGTNSDDPGNGGTCLLHL
jgi:uncharacterized protein YjbI with pentapeptide repeats